MPALLPARIHRQLPPGAADAGEHFADRGVEPAYHEVYSAISRASDVGPGLAAGADPQARYWP